jgi:phosphatidylserine decarboxylase
VAARYALPPLLAGTGLAAAGRRRAATAALGLAATVVLFFRDPGRFPQPGRPGMVYAVTDGRVMLVRDGVHVPWLPGGPWRQVSVFLTLADVHVAWTPVSGKLTSWTWRDGRGRAAMRQSAEDENRQARLTIETDRDPTDAPQTGRDATGPLQTGGDPTRAAQTGGDVIGVALIAGLIARRITRWAPPGTLPLGRRLGIIHFGSRCVIYLPADRYDLLVTKGDRLTAGVTPIARRRTDTM